MKIIKIDAIDSTNIFLKKFVKENNQISRLAVRADYQTKGKGRMNSKWYSEKGKNLTGSIFFRKIKINNRLISDEIVRFREIKKKNNFKKY